MHEKDAPLTRMLWHGLSSIEGVRVYGPGPEAKRTSLVSFTVGGIPSSEVSKALTGRGIFISHGDFYASTVLERLGVAEQGLVRAGISLYTTSDEIDRLLEGVRDIAKGRS